MSDTLVAAIIAATTAILSGVLVQLIGGMVQSRRDRERLAWERSKHQQDAQLERQKVSYDRLRDVCVRVVQGHSIQADAYLALHYDEDEYSWKADDLRSVSADRFAAEVELGLLAPHLSDRIKATRAALWEMDVTIRPMIDNWSEKNDTHERLVRELEEAMRELLDLERSRELER